MLIKKAADIHSSEITSKSLYLNRRKFLAGTAIAGAAALGGSAISRLSSPSTIAQANAKIDGIQKNSFSTAEKITPFKDVTNYNNYYEFSTDKYEPPVLDWPYVEGLRMDEAMHPLALLCFGMYGEVLPNQDGAPLRIVIPWKYGFKSAKAIVRIRFTDKQPVNSWNKAAPNEYGFYSNVNPNVDHPRWSQAKERRLGEFLKRPTLMFNGYDQVASLYSGMDLKKNF